MSALAWRAAGLVVVVALIALWGEIAALKLVSPVFLPTPERVWTALEHGFFHGSLGAKLVGTISHMLRRLACRVNHRRRARRADWHIEGGPRVLAPTLEFLRPLPASAIIPVAIAIFGLTPQMALGVIAFGSVWPALLAAIHGLRRSSRGSWRSNVFLNSLAGRAL